MADIRNKGLIIKTLIAVTLLDRVSKAVISRLPQDTIEVIPGFFNLVHVANRGAAFGILGDSGNIGAIFLAVVSILAIIIIAVLLARTNTRWISLSLSFIGGGALGNLIDRLWSGAVFDFMDIHLGAYHWPAFNVADSAITIGAGLYIAGSWLWKED
ncbi:MAG: signal peptidase II [Deltaproteobacteria bacterium]|nr:signal peptidase II [Deltaproteobacteria bacterium]